MLDTLRAGWRLNRGPLSRVVLAVCRHGNRAEWSRRRQLNHGGRGVAVRKRAVRAACCELYQGVAVGNRDASGEPVPGDEVILGAYAAVPGPVKVGDRAKVGPPAVVLIDVPQGRRCAHPRPRSCAAEGSRLAAPGWPGGPGALP